MNAMYMGVFWLVYYGLHSAFASDAVKRFFALRVAFAAPYYRLIYSFFATVNFLLLAWFHILIPSRNMFVPGMLSKVLALVFAVVGAIIFWKSAREYGVGFLVVEDYFGPIENDKLLTKGMHRMVRHPLYFALLLWLIALVLYFPSWKNLFFVVISALYILIGAMLEERKLIKKHGDQYLKYKREVPMLIPYLF